MKHEGYQPKNKITTALPNKGPNVVSAEGTCGNCGQAELEIRKVRCPHRRGLQDMVDFMGHARYDHPADEPACEHWIETPNTLEQRYKQLSEVAREMYGLIEFESYGGQATDFRRQLEELGVELCSRS